MIVCGFPGTGKSMMAKHCGEWIDLESTPFSRRNEWLLYAEVAKHMSDSGYVVMVSTHARLLESLEQIETPYIVVIPPMLDKGTYLSRYEMRGNSKEFIDNLGAHWEEWLVNITHHDSVLRTIVILPKDGCISAWAQEMRGL